MVEPIKQIIKLFLDKGYLITPELIEGIEVDINFLEKNLDINPSGELLVFNKNMMDKLLSKTTEIEKPLIEEKNIKNECIGSTNIVKSYNKKPQKVNVQDFITHYTNRYNTLKKILQNRNSLIAPLSINRIISKRERDSVSTIGLVYDKRNTKNNNIILTIEDNTGTISVLINNNKPELFEKCKNIVLDEVIGVKGSNGEKIIFADEIFFPDVTLGGTEMKKSVFFSHSFS